MWLPASNAQWALVPWRPRRDDPQARRFHSSASAPECARPGCAAPDGSATEGRDPLKMRPLKNPMALFTVAIATTMVSPIPHAVMRVRNPSIEP
jgi:hypothetical protein